MAKENKTIGRVPVSRHEYTDGATYYKDNIVTRYGSAFQCVVESTTTPPATIDASGKVTLGEGWIFFADASGVAEVKNGVAALERDLGQYAELPSVTMTAETTGKYINASGEFVDDADFNIAAIGAVVVGNTYELYMGSADKMKLGVALFVARIRTTTTSGTERIEYVPLFSAMSTDIPTSGYVCFEAMEAYSDVLVCYRADVPEAATLLVRRYGTKASIATQINNLRKKVDLKSFADGYYESMRVGTADNLTSKGDATEEVIMSRKAGGDNQIEDGSASIKRIKGNSFVLNQAIGSDTPWHPVYGTMTKTGISISYTYDTVGIQDFNQNRIAVNLFISDAHKYLICFQLTTSKEGKSLIGGSLIDAKTTEQAYTATIGLNKIAAIVTGIGTGKSDLRIGLPANNTINVGDTVSIEDIMLLDLTQMFGSGNEPTTPDDFAKRLGYSSIDDVPYIPYNEGEIVSSFAEGIKTTGKNLWDEMSSVGNLNNSTGEEVASDLTIRSSYVPILSANKIYLFNGSKRTDISFDKVLFYKNDKTFNGVKQYVNSGELDLPNNTSYIRFVLRPSYGVIYNHDVCVNVSDVTFNGNYEPYAERCRKWSETQKKYFPDGLKSAGSAYDEITPTKAVKVIKKVNLGNLNWGYATRFYFADFADTLIYDQKAIPGIICPLYPTVSAINAYNGKQGIFTKAEGVSKNGIAITDKSVTSVTELKAKVNGVFAYYESATPEEYTYDELNLTEQVAEGGTEEAIITEGKTSTPLRADIVYPIDAYNTIKANKTNIGTLSSLNTASKTDLVSAINELAGKVGALEAKATETATNETTE